MPISDRSNKLLKYCFLATSIFTASACSTMPKKNNAWFDASQVKKMYFKFEHSSKFFGADLQEQAIASQIAGNLAEWGYKIYSKNSDDYSHRVTIEIGSIKHDSTPAGFSFSSGNSNPRSPNFQKADVLPMRCLLTPKDEPDKNAELSILVDTSDYLRHADKANQQQKLVKLLVNDLSTACFNLLDNLRVKTALAEKQTKPGKPSWIPAIRVEVTNDNESSTIDTVDDMAQKSKKEPKKRIIIYNQGTPVIFKFGPER